MKNQNGITLVTLVIYIIVMIITMGVMSSIINNFYSNNKGIEDSVKDVLEFNKFNTYFLQEVKQEENSVEELNIENNYILFASGNSFSWTSESSNNKIYYNNIKVCEGLTKVNMQSTSNNTIIVELVFEKYSNTIEYKIEKIY